MSLGGFPIALLGFVADHRRVVKDGSKYDHLIPPSSGSYDIINPNGTVKHTVAEMDRFTRATLDDTKRLAPTLRGNTLVETLRNVFNFWYNHIQYKLDKEGVEELRRPKRTWRDGQVLTRNPKTEPQAGVDCDCFSIAVASTLLNLGIDCKFRITAYDGGWQHVYVVVPLPSNREKYWVIDCVLNSFNEEKIFSKKFDYNMSSTLSGLSGLPIAILGYTASATSQYSDEMDAVLHGAHFPKATDLDTAIDALGNTENLEGLGETTGKQVSSAITDSILQHITATRDYIRKNPTSVIMTGGAENHLKMLDYAIAQWNTPNRDKALDILAAEEEKWNAAAPGVAGLDDTGFDAPHEFELSGFEGYEELSAELGKLKGKGKQFFGNIKKAVKAADNFGKKIATKVIGEKAVAKIEKTKEKVQAAVKKVGEKAKEVAKKALGVIKKFIVLSNPLSLAARAGFLLAMKVNMFQWAQRLYPGLLTEAEAVSHGISSVAWNRSKDALDRVAGVFSKIGGKRSKLEKYIRNGRAKNRYTKGFKGFDGFVGLGTGISEAVTVVAAATALLTAASKMRQAGVSKKDYEQLQKTPAQKPVKGLGEDSSPRIMGDSQAPDTGIDEEVPEVENLETAPDGGVSESKGTLAKFIAMIKKWFSKNKHADVPGSGQEILREEEATASDPQEAKAQAEVEEEAKAEAELAETKAVAEGKSPADIQKAKDDAYNAVIKNALVKGYGNDDGDGVFAKIGRFVKENPKTSVAIGLVTAFGVAMCFEAPRKALFGPRKNTNRKFSSSAALAGTSSPRKKKSAKKKSASKHSKRIVLK